ncbi:MAG: cyclic nucleotide-binding domain-containing protein, partial [Actinobacteria bacterium]|nr:cyclic nucleotide-binding domain-containing protein [Actinomycetota bacterium]
LGRFRDQLDQLGRSVARGGFLSSLPGTTTNLSLLLIQVLALAGGAVAVFYGALGVGALVSFQLLLGGVTGPMLSITSIWQILLQSSVGMQRINELLDEPPKIVDAPDASDLGRFSREIRFEDVTFSYTGEQLDLRDVDLTILAGQSVAFVGPSGSGKSTILNLIMRFYDPKAGAVTIDGQDLRQVTQKSLRSQLGTVFQDTFLYNTTVRENITLGKLDATHEEVEAAAKAAEIHDFILTMPQNTRGLYYRLWGQQNGFADAERVGVEASRLRAIPFFENLDEALLSALAERFVVERHTEGHTIFEEGDPGDKLYFIDRGEVEVVVTGPTGEKRRVALLRDGDYFGEIALLEDVPRTATVRTRAPSILLGLDREQFLDLLGAVPELRVAFERGVEARRRANLAALQEVVQVGGGR